MPPKEENPEWWKKRVGWLKDVGKKVVSVQPEVCYEKAGLWPLLKLVNLDLALGFYVPIMNSQRSGGNWSKLHYVDVMAGNGLTRVTGEKSGIHQVAGTATIGANVEAKFPGKGFDHYHFVEPYKPWAQVLEDRLEALLPKGNFTVYPKSARESIPLIVEKIGAHAHFFCLVDPEGLTEITLPDLAPLFTVGRGDFLFNFQFTGPKRAPECAARFFGDADWPSTENEDEIRKFFWAKLGEHGRPRGASFTISAGEGHGRYAYEMYYCAAKTLGNNAWLDNFSETFNRRMKGMDGTQLDRLLGHHSLKSFF